MGKFRTFLVEFHPIVQSLVIGTVFVRVANSMSMPFLFIYLSKNTDMTAAQIGLAIGAGALASMIGGFIGGTLSDKFGRRLVMLAALYAWTIVFLGFAFGSSPFVFFVLNVLGGLCRSFYEPVSQALMADITPPNRHQRVFALRYTAINVGAAVGPLIGAMLAMFGDSLPFLLTGVIYLLYVISLQYLLKRFGITKIEGQKKEHVTFKKAVRVLVGDSAFGMYIIGGTLGAIGYSQMSGTLSKVAEIAVPDGAGLFAVLMSVNAVVVIVMQMPLSRWQEKRSPMRSITVGNAMYALGDVGFAFSHSWTMFIVSMAVFTLGEILTYTASDVFIDRLSPEGMRGTYFGAKSFSNLGHFIGPWMGGYLLAKYGGSTLFLTVACTSLIGTLFYWIGQRNYIVRTGKQLVREAAK